MNNLDGVKKITFGQIERIVERIINEEHNEETCSNCGDVKIYNQKNDRYECPKGCNKYDKQ